MHAQGLMSTSHKTTLSEGSSECPTMPCQSAMSWQTAAPVIATMLTKLFSETMERIVAEAGSYEQARRAHLEIMREGLDLGTHGRPVASRDELHER